MYTDKRALAVALAAICAFIDLYATQALLPLLARGIRRDAGRGQPYRQRHHLRGGAHRSLHRRGGGHARGASGVIVTAMFALVCADGDGGAGAEPRRASSSGASCRA